MDPTAVHEIAQQALGGSGAVSATQIISLFALGGIFIIILFAVMLWLIKLIVKPSNDKLDALAKALEDFKNEIKIPIALIKSDKEMENERELLISKHINACGNRQLFETMNNHVADVVKENSAIIKDNTAVSKELVTAIHALIPKHKV